MKHYINLIVISLVSVFIHGYQFAVSDQEIFIPYILQSANASLFPGDALFNQSSAHLSLFYPLIGLLTNFFDIQTIFFVGYLIFQFAFFAGIYRLAKILLKNERLAYFSLLSFILPKFIGGTATQTFDLFFGYRSVGVVFLVFYLSYLLEKKYAKSLIIAFVGILFHPLSIIPSALTLPVLFLSYSKSKTKDCLKIIISSLLLVVTSYIVLGRDFFNTLFSKNELWYSIIKFRDAYVFASSWQLIGWAAFFLYLTLVILVASDISKGIRKTIINVTVISLVVFLANAILLDFLKLPGFAQFQLVRSITPIAYLGLALSPLFLSYKNKVLKISGFLAFLFLALNLFYLFLFTAIIFSVGVYLVKEKKQMKLQKNTFLLACTLIIIIYISMNLQSFTGIQNKYQFPKRDDDWISLQKWVLQNTNKTAKFLVPPTQTGFRIFSQRSIVGDIKDGAVVIYSPNFANHWHSIANDIFSYESLEEPNFLQLQRKYQFEYFVTKIYTKLNFSLIYQNNSFNIYKI